MVVCPSYQRSSISLVGIILYIELDVKLILSTDVVKLEILSTKSEILIRHGEPSASKFECCNG
jgi:hypothetical protein